MSDEFASSPLLNEIWQLKPKYLTTTQQQNNRKGFADQGERLGSFRAAIFNTSVLPPAFAMLQMLLLKHLSIVVYAVFWKLCSSDLS